MNYLMADGRELYVTDGFSEGRTWFTAYKAPTGSTRRYKWLPWGSDSCSMFARWIGHDRREDHDAVRGRA